MTIASTTSQARLIPWRRHLDECFERQEARIDTKFAALDAKFDALQRTMILTLGGILATFGGILLAAQL